MSDRGAYDDYNYAGYYPDSTVHSSSEKGRLHFKQYLAGLRILIEVRKN